MGEERGTAAGRRRRPHPGLRGLVTDYQGYRYDALTPGGHHGLPSTVLTLVLSFDQPLHVGWLSAERSLDRHWALASGLHVGPALIRHDGTQHGLQLGLTPAGARTLLGMPAGPLAGEMVPLQALLGPDAERLYADVAGCRTWEERFDALDRHLLARAGTRAAEVRSELRCAWQSLVRSAGTVKVQHLAADLGWSRRHLTGRFGAEFGVTPKQLARVSRFQRARGDVLRSAGADLAETAARCGYSDQAHLTREWRALAGYTPRQWLREEFPFLQDSGSHG
jgi:AraC-like DNA-binding protein